ncbi:spore coat protein A [Scopulibacillus daqui]|uniref:Spore coat protein A n=1 Tax=Scopulibacillus daqui TaxID=1469162 RepID=A0ABS2Q2Z0_9BACL|nr:multicopper oxidase [Scopulibacillus daqui]MBM7646667.1 spore coat protein A [Scopulibacillus daqui]
MRLSQPLEKFVDECPIPEILKPKVKNHKGDYYEVTMEEMTQKLHRDLNPTRLWGYNGMYPGPTIEAEKDNLTLVKWINKLPDKHLLPVDKTIHGAMNHPEVRTVVHLHGGASPAPSDGYPEAWFTRDFKEVGPYFKRKIYQYPNLQRSAALWYHDHAMGITRLNVYAGLCGFYIIRDSHERSLNLPKGDYEIPLMIQDKSFNEDGSLYYPKQPANPSSTTPDPSITPFFCGDTILVNGKVWPYLEVEPRKYRFRLLNASNTRTFELKLDAGQSMYQIGTDGGFLQRPVKIDKLTLAPAERADVIIDFSQYEHQHLTLKNDSGCGGPVNPDTDANVMQFKVTRPLSAKDKSKIPSNLESSSTQAMPFVRSIRTLKLGQRSDEYGRPMLLLDNHQWEDPVTEKPQLGDTEIWSIVNPMGVTHSIHLHLVQFKILDRRPFDADIFNQTGRIVYTGSSVAPELNERGFKDTARAPAGQVTRIMVHFTPFTGRYVWHCHILEHEDYDMMRPYLVVKRRE